MSLFEDREQAFENLFVHEEDMRFRAAARRNRKLASWAGDRMGDSPRDAEAYASFIVRLGAFFGDDGVRARILHDLGAAGVPVSEHRIRRMMDEWLADELAQTSRSEPRTLSGAH